MEPGTATFREPRPLGSASLAEETAATTQHGVSPSNEPSPGESIEGFFQPLIESRTHAATLASLRVEVRSICPNSRAKQSRKTKLNIISTGGWPPARGSFHKNLFERSDLSASRPRMKPVCHSHQSLSSRNIRSRNEIRQVRLVQIHLILTRFAISAIRGHFVARYRWGFNGSSKVPERSCG